MEYFVRYENPKYGFYIVSFEDKNYVGPPFIEGCEITESQVEEIISSGKWTKNEDKKVFYKPTSLGEYFKKESFTSSILRLIDLQKFMNKGKLLNTTSVEDAVDKMIEKLYREHKNNVWEKTEIAYFGSSISKVYDLNKEQKNKLIELTKELISKDDDISVIPRYIINRRRK